MHKTAPLVVEELSGFLVMDLEWRITYINPPGEKLLQRSAGYMIGKNLWEEFPSAIDHKFYNGCHYALKTGKTIHIEDYSIALEKWLHSTIYPSSNGVAVHFYDPAKLKAAEEARKGEEKYKAFIERITDAFIALDNNWRYTYLNKRASELIQHDAADLIGKNVWDVFPDAVGSQTYKAMLKAMQEQRYLCNVDYYAPLDLWHENHIYPSADGISVFIRDISERKKTEEDLLQTQMRLKQAQEIAHLGSWVIDLKKGTSQWSDEAYRIYGIIPGDHNFSYEEWLSFIHPDDLPEVLRTTGEAHKTLSDHSFHHRILRKDGTIRYVYSEGKYEFDKDGKPITLYGISYDETEQKKAEEELKKSNERFYYATHATSDIIWELNFETRQYLVHEGGERLFGPAAKLTWQMGVEGKYIVEADRERIRESFREARRDPNRKLWHDEYRVIYGNNEISYIINHAIFIRDKNGKAVRAIGAITDVTEKKKLEAELLKQQRNQQLQIIVTALEAQEKERNAIGQELHDNVNQILVGTKVVLNMMKDHGYGQSLLDSCIRNIQHVIDENRKIAHVLVAPDLQTKSLARQISELSGNMLKVTGMSLHINTDSLNEALLTDDQKLAVYRIAQEQCTNILKYSKATAAEILLYTTDDSFVMTISDNGVGMKTSKTTRGIGLRNIEGRLSVFNGYLNIVTAPGKGFALEVTIPLAVK